MISEGHILDETYRLIRRVGEGGMGVVYEATHARLAGRYAIKVLLQNLADDPGALMRFDREARITSSLQHPNVVQVIDHNTTPDGTSYLVMELLAGESLATRLARSGPMEPAPVVEIVDQIAAGLTAAHRHGIVHRDLKPDNVFLVPVEGRRDDLVKILDFGISRSGSGIHEVDRELCGTPEYMSPEQVEGSAEIAGATDQFALAVIAYELLTGRNPFRGESLAETFSKVAAQEPPPTGVGAAVDAVLARGFAKSKALRFPTVTEFAMALREAVGALQARTPTPTPTYATGEMVVVTDVRRSAQGRASGQGRNAGWAVGGAIVISVATVVFFGGGGESVYSRPAAAARTPAPNGPPDRPDRIDSGLPLAPPPLVEEQPVKDNPVVAPARALVPETLPPPSGHLKRTRSRDKRSHDDRSDVSALPRAPSLLAPDEDATLPLTES